MRRLIAGKQRNVGTDDTILDTQGPATAVEADALEPATARWLKISVSRDGRSVVQVSFPAYAIVNLPDLVPDEVRPRVAAQRIDLEHLAATAAAEGCPPGEIFCLSGPDNLVRAWLE
jgi:hypothetical protein